MRLSIDVSLQYHMPHPTDLLLQIEAANMPDQGVERANIDISETEHFARVAAEDGIGERIWLRVEGDFTCRYTAQIAIDRPTLDIAALTSVSPHLLPGDVVHYMMPSRYCPSDEFQAFVSGEFSGLIGGRLIAEMRDWISDKFEYVPGASNAQTTALESFVQRQGICRDYAHVMITLARAAAIPARFASVYAPGVTPPDFHAVAEVYLEGTWHLIDPTGMATPSDIARIGVASDAAGVSFMTSYGNAEFRNQSVSVSAATA